MGGSGFRDLGSEVLGSRFRPALARLLLITLECHQTDTTVRSMEFVCDPGLGQGFTVQGYLALVEFGQAGCRTNYHASISSNRSILILFFEPLVCDFPRSESLFRSNWPLRRPAAALNL